MARKRSLKPEFHEDTTLANCDIQARYLYAGLWCYMDSQGLIEANVRYIKSKVFPYDEISANLINKWLSQLIAERRLIKFHWQGKDLLLCPKFKEHQRIYSDEKKRFDVPDEFLSSLLIDTLSPPGDGGKTPGTCAGDVKEEEEVKEEEGECEGILETDPLGQFLENVYAMYPKRRGTKKGKGMKSIRRQLEAHPEWETEFQMAVENYAADCVANKTGTKFIKMWATFCGSLEDPETWREWIRPPETEEPQQEDLSDRIKRAVSHYGYTNGQAAMDWLGEMAWARVKALGGWSSLCRLSEWDLNQKLKGAS